jgi:hypothetical protein
MNYKKLYTSIITRRQQNIPLDVYTERHHILPRSLGGKNKNNLVSLTAREHFICHLLLTKIYQDDKISYSKMVKAFGMMVWMHGENQERYKVSSRKYQKLKEEFSRIRQEEQKGKLNSRFGYFWVTNGTENKNIKPTEEIPNGWVKGRYLPILRVKHFCQKCKIELEYRKNGNYFKYCSSCREQLGYRKPGRKPLSKNCVICNGIFFKRNVKTCSMSCKETYRKQVNGLKSRKKIQCIETGEIFNSLTLAAEKIGSSIALISYMLSGNVISAKGFTFKFID